LCRTETIGPISFYAMLRRFGSARAALEMVPQLARRSERSKTVTPVTRAEAETELAALNRIGAGLVCWGEPHYPTALAAIDDAPPILAVLGRAELLDRPMVAVVGARNASANGRRLSRDLAAALGREGVVVVSGLARGIDAAAHLGALETGSTAVVAGGVDVVYPEENRGCTTPWRVRVRSSPSSRPEPNLRHGISRAAIGSSPGWRSALSSSKPRRVQGR
jgi:DNA processing protein